MVVGKRSLVYFWRKIAVFVLQNAKSDLRLLDELQIQLRREN